MFQFCFVFGCFLTCDISYASNVSNMIIINVHVAPHFHLHISLSTSHCILSSSSVKFCGSSRSIFPFIYYYYFVFSPLFLLSSGCAKDIIQPSTAIPITYKTSHYKTVCTRCSFSPERKAFHVLWHFLSDRIPRMLQTMPIALLPLGPESRNRMKTLRYDGSIWLPGFCQ